MTSLLLGWTTPWHNGRDITKYQYRYAPGTSIASSVTWVDIPDSAPGLANANAYRVTELISGTEYTFEVRAVNGIGNGAEATATATTPMPTWELTLTDSNGNAVTELVESGASATVTVRITNGVRFSTDQTVALKWNGLDIRVGLIQGAGGTDTITIPAGESSGSLDISAPELGGTVVHQPRLTGALTAVHEGSQVGNSIDLSFVDDEPAPVATITGAPTTVDEGENIEVEITLNPASGASGNVKLTVNDDDSALSGTLPATELRFSGGQRTNTITLTAADNEVQNDGAREVTFTLALNPNDFYTLGEPSSVTVTVLDNDTPPSAPRNLAAEARDGEARLRWQAPLTDNGQAVTGYEYRHKAGTGSFGAWTDILGSNGNTTEYTVTGLANGTLYTFEVQAENTAGQSGPSNQARATPVAGDTTAPVLRSASTTALALGLTYDENLDASSEPAPSAFTVTVDGASRAVTGVALDETKVLLTLATAVRAGDTVTVSYTVPANNPLRDEASNRAAAFSDHPVTNEVPATAPAAPTGLTATPGDGSVTLRWTAPAHDGGSEVTSHQYRQKTTGDFGSWQDIELSAPGEANATSYPVTSLANDTAYTFEVQARNAEGESGPSNQASATPAAVPSAPRSLTATAGNGEVRLQWLAPASNGGSAILRYQYRQRYGSQAYGNWTDIADSAPGEANANSYTVTGLLGNAQYRFKVRAVNTGGPGAESNEVVETPVPVTRPEQLRAPQKAWMARFDRTVATQVVDAIGDRLSGGGTRGVTVGGQSLNRSGGAVDDALARDRLLGEPGAEPKGLSMDGRELLLGSSFSVGGGGKDGAPSWGAWGRFATGGFEADADGMRVEGDVTTGLLGADASRGRWLAGVAVSLSRGEGPFRLTSAMDSNRGRGTVESSLTALYPYAKLGLSDRMEAWGLVGLGTGELTVRESGGTPIETDLGMTMGAVGARGRLLSAGAGGGLDLALRSDAMWVRMKSDAVSNGEGNLAAAQALVSRLRLIVEGSRTFAMADERTITPRGEVGVRHDLGDAETGTGLEAGAGVKFAGDGFSIEGAVRALVAHEDAHYREWGASGAIRVDPGAAGRGLSLSIAPTWGNAASAAARLWSAPDAAGLAPDRTFEPGSRLEAELGYGVGAPHGPGLVTPYAGLTLSGDAPRALRTGVRWNASPSATMSLEASREAQGSGEAPANALTLRAEVRW